MNEEISETSKTTSDIATFFTNRSVFLTGATGFVGKGVLEKILRACPDVRHVYVMIRTKSNVDVNRRLENLLKSSIFETVRATNPEVFNKVIPISGDVCLTDLGISLEFQQILVDQVSIFINAAATIKFDAKLKEIFNINTLGTKRIIDLCSKMKNLKAVVHVSTAYSNNDRRTIDEIVYPINVNLEQLASSLEWMTDEMVDAITPALIAPKTNTYIFTKSLAEHIWNENDNIPVSIVRPSIVVSTWKEPVAGWIDNFNGSIAPIVTNGLGALRSLPCDSKKMIDIFPLDSTVNLILAAAWNCATQQSTAMEVYHGCSGTLNSMTYRTFFDWSTKFMIKFPLSNAIWYPNTQLNSNPTWHAIKHFIWHYLPIHLLYLVEVVLRKPSRMKTLYRQLSNLKLLSPFTTQDWNFDTTKTRNLYLRMSPIDQDLFNFNLDRINWKEFMFNCCLGIRTYLMKDDPKTLPVARARMRKFKWVHNGFRLLLTLISVWFISFLFLLNKN